MWCMVAVDQFQEATDKLEQSFVVTIWMREFLLFHNRGGGQWWMQLQECSVSVILPFLLLYST